MTTYRHSAVTSRPPRLDAEPTPHEVAGAPGGERALRAMLRAALEAVPSGAFLLTSAGAILEVNETGKAWLQRDAGRAAALREALRGRPPADLLVTNITGAGGTFLLVQRDLAEHRDRSSVPPQSP